ncbi:MAG: (Fe-S)-binding protein [Actinobacteria bacterium]|jgi:Fe-S oxidoreductase|nr:(Fe-S)-binding protein [Actinomycetota bacterium]
MSLPTGEVIGILADNLRIRGSVLPLSKRKVTRWARGLNLPHGGRTVLYTGMMYQLIPYIEGLVKAEKRLGDSPLAELTWLGRKINRLVNISAFMARPSAKLRAVYNEVPVNVALLLKEAGVEFGYLYKDDLYSGALAHDLGADEVVADHARKVYGVLRKRGVRRIITIDPHTTNMLRSVYPKLIPGFDIEIRSYLEVLAEREPMLRTSLTGELVIHDPCVFARYEGIVHEPRRLLTATGLTLKEPEKSGRMTYCCGGPVESLYPEKAEANARRRVEQLQEAVRGSDQRSDREACEIVTMCPMCFVNLAAAAPDGVALNDISHYLRRAYVS